MWRLPERSKVIAKRLKAEGGGDERTLLSFHGKVKDDLIRQFRDRYNREGVHIKTGARLAAQCFGTIGAGGAAWGLSSHLSSQLFIATANVDTLMKIGAGVGSQVVTGGQIVAQAPFVAASSAVMPIAAPILLFQAMTTVMIMNEFRLVHDKFNELHRGINRVLQRSEANHIAAIISAAAKIEEIESQLTSCKEFTPSMVMRLCVLEDKVSSIVERYKFLYEQELIDLAAKNDQLKFKDGDAYFAVIASILDLRLDLLRLKLAVQESPAYMMQVQSNFLDKCEAYNRLFEDIDRFRLKTNLMPIQLGETIEAMNWWERNMPNWVWGDRDKSRTLQEQKDEFESHLEASGRRRNQGVTNARQITDKLIRQVSEPMNLVYWRDELGEHSYYTADVKFKPLG